MITASPITPWLADAQSNRWIALKLANPTAESLTHFEETLRIKPEFAQARADREVAQKHVQQPHGHHATADRDGLNRGDLFVRE